MFARLLFLMLVTPTVELALLWQLGEVIGTWPTLGLIVVTGITGSYLAKREGLSAWNRLQDEFGRGGLPGKEILDAVIVLIAGALLLTPGVITDLLGFAGLFPPTRSLIRRYAMRRFKRAVRNGAIQTSWGGLGISSSPPPEGAPPDPSEQTAEEEPRWEGEGRAVPRHAAEEINGAGAAESDERTKEKE